MPCSRANRSARFVSRLATATTSTPSALRAPASNSRLIFAVDMIPHFTATLETLENLPTDVITFAPGRVNLIGEHTDYNAGLALPFAIAQGVTVAADALPEPRIEVHALDLEA